MKEFLLSKSLNNHLPKFICALFIVTFLANSSNAQTTLSITSPTSAAATFVVGSTISVTTSSSGLSGKTVTFTLGSLTSGPISTSPFATSFNTSTLTPGAYTLTAVASNGTHTTATPVTITILPAAPTALNALTCGGPAATVSASGGSPAGGTYNWYAASSGGPVLQSNVSPNYTVPAVAKNYYVSYTYPAGSAFESARTAVSVTVTAAATSTFTMQSTVAVGTVTSNITYTGSDPATSTFNWDFNGGTIVSGSGKGPYTVMWTTPGNHPVTLTVTNVAGCPSSSTGVITVTGITLGNYGFSKPIVLNTSSAGISSSLSSFPALVYIKDDALKILNNCGDKLQFPLGNGGGLANGTNYDFAFTVPGSTTELNYQVENYDPTNGILLAWVKVPTVTSANTALTFYFGSLNPTHTAATAAATWTSDYQAVYHFNDAATATIQDATSFNVAGTPTALAAATDEIHSITGTLGGTGGGYTLNGSSSKILTTTKADITGVFTLSAWVYVTTPSGDNKVIANELNFGPGYKLSVKHGVIETETRSTNANDHSSFGDAGNLGDGGTITASAWHYIQGVFNGSTFTNYLDGAPVTTTTTPSGPTSEPITPYAGNFITLGLDHCDGNPAHDIPANSGTAFDGSFFGGKMDEVRVSNVIKSADWIKCEYYNQSNPITFTDNTGAITAYQPNASNLVGAETYTWTGSTSTDPTVASNWDIGLTPVFNGNTKMSIPVVSSNQYPLLTADESVYELTISNGASINLNGHTLNVGCNIFNSATTAGTGILNAGSAISGINWNGSIAAQTYTGTNNPTTAEIGIMTVNNSSAATITINGGPIDIFNQLTLTKGNLAINNATNGALTLKSTSTLTASVTAIPSSYSVTGNVNVERFISGGSNTYRGYRLLSSPIYTAKSGTNYYYDLSYLPKFAPITGSLGTAGGLSKAGNPSMYLYRDNVAFTNATFNTGNFRGINTINNVPLYSIGVDYDGNFNLHPGTGVLFFYRGTLANIATKYTPSTSAEPGLFVSTGVLNQQSVTVTNWYTGSTTLQVSVVPGNTGYSGYNLVGNPYASSIDWLTFSASSPGAGIYGPGVGKTIYIINETTKLYATYDQTLGVNGGSNIIPSGQGFFVKASTATTSTPQLIFNESAKTNAQLSGPTQATGPTLLLSRKPVAAAPELQYLRLELDADTINKEETIVRFDSQAKNEYVFNEDSQHFTGAGIISLASLSTDNVQMAINNMPLPKQTQKIKLNVNTTADGLFKLNMTEIKAIPEIYEIWLMDNYKKDSLDMRHNSTYSFNVMRSDTNSYGSNRFSLIIRQNQALGVHLLTFAGVKSTDGSLLTWKTENEENYTNFTIERSTDYGKTFDVLGGFSSDDQGTYSFTDKKPPVAADEYRLKIEDLNDSTSYSKIVTLLYGNLADNKINNLVSVYPNPAINNINLAIVQNANSAQGSDNAMYNIMIMSSNGTVVKTVDSSQNTWQGNVSNLLPGTYIVQVINNNDKSLVGKTKFVKL